MYEVNLEQEAAKAASCFCFVVSGDTIAAISSAASPAARIIVRLSGPSSHPIARQTTIDADLTPAAARRTMLRLGDLQCPVWIYAFRAPRSYSGEDAIEFHLPGSAVLAKMLLDDLYRRGVRAAEPGEFTARAFFNGKIGLTEAEGVAATISAGNEAELTAARQLLAGELARRLAPITDSLAQTLALIEVGIDFTEEDVTFLANQEVAQHLEEADGALVDLLDQSSRFEQLTHEPRIAFAGRPNAGKSSLINTLTGQSRAVVSEIAGTTRDVLTAPLDLPRGRVLLSDVAGIDPASGGADPQSQIDLAMQLRANSAIESADHVVLVRDCVDPRPALKLPRAVVAVVLTKSDLLTQAPDVHPGLRVIATTADATHSTEAPDEHPGLCVSVKTGEGMQALREALDSLAFGEDRSGAAIALNRRHISAIHSARQALSRAQSRIAENSSELVAMDLRDVLDCLGSIVGQITSDDLLGRIFSAFCIGK